MKSLIMEIRPRLQSVNVFIIFLKKVSLNVRIRLNSDNFEIIDGFNVKIVKCEYFLIIPNSLTCFKIQDDCVTFRFATENIKNNYGSAKFEIVKNYEKTTKNDFNIFLNVDTLFKINCGNCERVFAQIKFERVLPLPDFPDNQDFFCHASESADKGILLPKPTETFYSSCFTYFNGTVLDGLMKSEVILLCKRCLAWIGVVTKEGAFKIWFNCVGFNQTKTNPLIDVFITIRLILDNSLINSVKLILNCSSSANHKDFVLLWILEKKLQVLFNSETLYVAKVLFKFQNHRDQVVNDWLTDPSVNAVEISKPMILSLLKHLYEMNNYIPKQFNVSNNFFVSYIKLFNE